MAPESAYALRRRPGAAEFCAAWTAALDHGIDRLVSVTMERAIHGVAVPVFWQGKQVGERRIYNDRLAMFHLRHRLPDRYGTPQPAPKRIGSTRVVEYDPDRQEEEERHAEEVGARMRLRVTRMHENWRGIIFRDPAKRAAYKLLFGEGGADDARYGSGIRFSRFPPELSHALIGIAKDEAADRKGEEAPE